MRLVIVSVFILVFMQGCSSLEKIQDGYNSLMVYDIKTCGTLRDESKKKACLLQLNEAEEKYKTQTSQECRQIQVEQERSRCLVVVESETKLRIKSEAINFKKSVDELESKFKKLPKDSSEATVSSTKVLFSTAMELQNKKLDFDSTNDDQLRISDIVQDLKTRLGQLESDKVTQDFINQHNAGIAKASELSEKNRKSYPEEYSKCIQIQSKVRSLMERFQLKAREQMSASSDRRKKELNAETDNIAYQVDKLKPESTKYNCTRFFN